MDQFTAKVWKFTHTIPRGKVATYGRVAYKIGNPGAARAVGTALGKNRSSKVPCHRVVCADGVLGGYAWGLPSKEKRLRDEGVEVREGKVDLKKYSM